MRLATPFRLAVVPLLLALAAGAAGAGQVRVTLSGTSFTPPDITVNAGDHVVWVWVSGSHTVTSGNPTTQTPNGFFNSGGAPFGISGARYSWKSVAGQSTQYYCVPHAPFMAGSVNVVASGAPVADFRISEVDFGAAGGLDFIEIANLGAAAGNLGQYRLSLQAGVAITLPLVDIAVPVAGRVVLHFNQSGTNTQTNLFFPGVTLARTGSAALFAPNTINTVLTDGTQMIDFVQWGVPGVDPDQANATTANGAIWSGGQFAPQVADGHSIELCVSDPSQHGAGFWQGVATPNPGTSNCSTSTLRATWGRLKILYR